MKQWGLVGSYYSVGPLGSSLLWLHHRCTVCTHTANAEQPAVLLQIRAKLADVSQLDTLALSQLYQIELAVRLRKDRDGTGSRVMRPHSHLTRCS